MIEGRFYQYPFKDLNISLSGKSWQKLNRLRDKREDVITFSGLIAEMISRECEREGIE